MVEIRKDYIGTEELAGRWACTKRDILHLVLRGYLVPAAFLDGDIGVHFLGGEVVGDDFNGGWDTPFMPDEEGYRAPRERLDGMFFLHSPKQTGLYECSFQAVSNNANPTAPDEWWMLDGYISSESCELVFFLEEIKRYELFAASDAEKSPAREQVAERAGHPMAARQEKTYLNMIGALSELLWKKMREQGKDKDVVQSRIVDAILDNFPKVQGLSESNLKKYIAKGVQSVRGDLDG